MRGNVDSEAVDRLTAVRNPAPRCGERPQTRPRKLILGECKPVNLGPGLDHSAPFLLLGLGQTGHCHRKLEWAACFRWCLSACGEQFMGSPLKSIGGQVCAGATYISSSDHPRRILMYEA